MPFLPQNIRDQNRGTFVNSARGFATLLALGVTIFATPLLWDQVEGTLWGWLSSLYGGDTASWLYWLLKLGAYPLVFTALRMSLVTLFVSAALVGAMRLV